MTFFSEEADGRKDRSSGRKEGRKGHASDIYTMMWKVSEDWQHKYSSVFFSREGKEGKRKFLLPPHLISFCSSLLRLARRKKGSVTAANELLFVVVAPKLQLACSNSNLDYFSYHVSSGFFSAPLFLCVLLLLRMNEMDGVGMRGQQSGFVVHTYVRMKVSPWLIARRQKGRRRHQRRLILISGSTKVSQYYTSWDLLFPSSSPP